MAEKCDANNTIYLTYDEAVQDSYSPGDKIFVTVGMPIVAFLGLSNNLAFLFVLYRVKTMRTLTNFYLGNLAVADSCYLLIMTVRHVSQYIFLSPIRKNSPWKNPLGCFLPYFVTYAVYFCSVFLVMLIATERYFAICHALRHRAMNGKTRALAMIITTWILSFGLAGFENNSTSTEQVCYVLPQDNRLIITYDCISSCSYCFVTTCGIDLAQFLIAVILTSFMYIQIVMAVSKRDVGGMSTNNNTKNRNAVVRMVIINSVIFFLCSCPFQLINIEELYIKFKDDYMFTAHQYHLIAWFGRVASLVNATVNPVVYSLTNSRYRQAFYEAFNIKYGEKDKQQSRLTAVSLVNMQRDSDKL